MQYRVIARQSYTADDGGLTTEMANRLIAAGFTRSATGTFESAAMELGEIAEGLEGVLERLAELDDHAGPRLKHFWLYIDGPIVMDPAEALLGPE